MLDFQEKFWTKLIPYRKFHSRMEC